MSFYGNVINPPDRFDSIALGPDQVGRENPTLTVKEGGPVLYLVGDGFISIDKESNNTIQIGAIVTDGLYVKSSDWNDNDPKTQKYFKLTVNSKGVLEIYEVSKEAN
jgi:hypothetical protein